MTAMWNPGWLSAVVPLLSALVFVNGSPPVFNVSFTIMDDSPAQYYIGNILVAAGLNNRYSSEEKRKISLRILEQPAGHASLFALDSRGGALRTNRTLDRDSICPAQKRCELSLNIIVTPTQYVAVVKVKAIVEDRNDNWPKFPSPVYKIDISETAGPGETYILPSAEDPDSPRYGVQNYKLQTPNDVFRLVSSDSDINGLQLELLKPLDRETKASYELVLIGEDGGTPRRSGTVNIKIAVADSNDNRPQFVQSIYNVTVSETMDVGSTITTVKASDKDEGLNGKVQYFLRTKTLEQYGDKFAMEPNTGELILKRNLDFSEAPVYELSIMAKDRGANPIPVYAKVRVTVLDVNNNAPEISVNHGKDVRNVSITEGNRPGRFVTYLSIRDADTGISGTFTCRLNNSAFNVQHIFGPEYQVVTAGALDREFHNYLTVRVTCIDKGNPPLSSHANVLIKLLDINDNTPRFMKTTLAAFVNENAIPNTYLTKVRATDKDIGGNGQVRYRAASISQAYITVNPIDGTVRTRAIFDYEKMRHIKVYIVAYDLGTPTLSTTATIAVTVLDTNDEKPVFLEAHYSFDLPENGPNGTMVGSVYARDNDSSPYNKFTFYIDLRTSDRGVGSLFSIDGKRGTISSHHALDHEIKALYSFTVVVRDDKAPRLHSSVKVTVYVSDENDNSPDFVFPNSYNNTINIRGSIKVGQAICTLKATDADGTDNGRVSYYIVQGNTRGLFYLDSESGSLTLARDVTGVTAKNFTLAVVAKDHGHPQKTNLTYLHIIIDPNLVVARRNAGRVPDRDSPLIVIIVGCVAGIIIVVLTLVLVVVKYHLRSKPPSPTIHFRVTSDLEIAGPGGKGIQPTDLESSYDRCSSGFLSADIERHVMGVDIIKDPRRSSVTSNGGLVPSPRNSFSKEPAPHWSMPQEGDNNSSTEESVTDSGRGISDEGSITNGIDTDGMTAIKPDHRQMYGQNIPFLRQCDVSPRTSLAAAHGFQDGGAPDDVKDGLTALWNKFHHGGDNNNKQQALPPKRKHRVKFVDRPSMMGEENNDVRRQRRMKPSPSKSDSNLSRKRKHGESGGAMRPDYRNTMPPIIELCSSSGGVSETCDSDSDGGSTTTSGSYVVDGEDVCVSLENIHSSVVV